MALALEKQVLAIPPVIFPAPTAPEKPAAPDANQVARRAAEREGARRDEEASLVRWRQICDVGSVDKWIEAQIRSKGLSQAEVDPSKLSGEALQAFKDKKRVEADERRALRKAAWQAYRASHIVHLGPGIHWDELADPDTFDLVEREERAKSLGLPDLKTADDLAKALGLSISRLRWLTYHREVDTGTHYRRWSIPKRNGKLRTITAPKKDMKAAQRWALRNVFEKLPVHGAAHGFLPSRSIASNALVHAGAPLIVKMDLQDFFPSLGWRRVKGLLRSAGMAEPVATLLALLCTEPPRELVQFRGKKLYVAKGQRALPQGAPTSPAITNAICLHMDRRLSGLCRRLGFKYTRYADDLAFSWHSDEEAPITKLLGGVKRIVPSEGFRVNDDKTRVLRTSTCQRITGLVVNRPPADLGRPVPAARVPRKTLRELRAALHNREKGKPGKQGETLAQLRGMAAFVFMVDPVRGRALLQRVEALQKKQG